MCSLFVPKTQTDNKGKPLGLPPCPSFLGLIRVNDKPLRGSLRESSTLHWQHKGVFGIVKNIFTTASFRVIIIVKINFYNEKRRKQNDTVGGVG